MSNIEKYCNFKILLSLIHSEELIERDYFGPREFNDIIQLLKIILNGGYEYQLFDKKYIETCKKFIIKIKNNHLEYLEDCNELLEYLKNPIGKPTDEYYILKYNIRNDSNVTKLTSGIHTDVINGIISEGHILFFILNNKKIRYPDVEILKAINIFLTEYPDVIYHQKLMNLISEKNSNYKNPEIQKLLESIHYKIKKIYARNTENKKVYAEVQKKVWLDEILNYDFNLLNEEYIYNNENYKSIKSLIENQNQLFNPDICIYLIELLFEFDKRKLIPSRDEYNYLKVTLNEKTMGSHNSAQVRGYYYTELYKKLFPEIATANVIYSKQLEESVRKLNVFFIILLNEIIKGKQQFVKIDSDLLNVLVEYLKTNYPHIYEDELYRKRIQRLLSYHHFSEIEDEIQKILSCDQFSDIEDEIQQKTKK